MLNHSVSSFFFYGLLISDYFSSLMVTWFLGYTYIELNSANLSHFGPISTTSNLPHQRRTSRMEPTLFCRPKTSNQVLYLYL